MSKIRKITGQAQNIAYQVNKVIEQLEAIINQKLAKDGSEPLTGNLDMNKHTINNLGYLDLRKTKIFIDDGESFEEPVSYKQLNNLHRMLTGKSLPEVPEEGSGSGVNADKLDGEDSFYYLDPKNFPFENYILGFKATNFRDAIVELYFKVMKHLEDDKFPRLGGYLDTNGHNIVHTEVLNTSADGMTYIDWSKSNVQRLLLTKDTKVTFYSPIKQAHLTLIIQQDKYGNHSLVLPPMKTINGELIKLSVEGNSEDVLFLYFDGSNYIVNPLVNLKLAEHPVYIPVVEDGSGSGYTRPTLVEAKFPFRDRYVYEFKNKTYLRSEDESGNAFNFDEDDFSIEMWAKPYKTEGSNTLVYKVDRDNDGYVFEINNGSLRFTIKDGGNTYQKAITSLIEENKWQHFAVVRDGDYFRFYINGQLANEYDEASGFSASAEWSLNLGIMTVPSDEKSPEEDESLRSSYYEGLMCEVAFWKRALTGEELSNRLVEELKGNEEGMIAYYKLDKGEYTNITRNDWTNIAIPDNRENNNGTPRIIVIKPGEWVEVKVNEDNNAS